jgi:tetratricopeptide (TPR) repeat protein
LEWPRHIRAGVMTVRGDNALAATEYRRILESDPSDPAALIAVLQDCRTRRDAADAIVAAKHALDLDPANFTALDGLAWAYLEQGKHHQAKTAIESAVRALDGLDTGAAFRGVPRVMLSVVRLFLRLPVLRRRFPHLQSTSEMEAQAARGLSEWRIWALEYLAWYHGQYPQGSPGAQQ